MAGLTQYYRGEPTSNPSVPQAKAGGFISLVKSMWPGNQSKEDKDINQHQRRSPVQDQPRSKPGHIDTGAGSDWEDIKMSQLEGMQEPTIEQLKEQHALDVVKIEELKRRAEVAEASAQAKEGAIVKLLKEVQQSKSHCKSKIDDGDDVDVSGLVTRIDDFLITEERLKKDVQEKEDQRYKATQEVIALQNELHNSDGHVRDLQEECKRLKNELTETLKVLDVGPVDAEVPEDVDKNTLICQLKERIKMLEGQLEQVKGHMKTQSREIQALKQQQEGMEMNREQFESYKNLYEESEAQANILRETKNSEIAILKKDIESFKAELADKKEFEKHLQQQKETIKGQFDLLRKQFNEFEKQHLEVVTLLKSKLEDKEAEVITYKLDFEDERKDRASAHSKFADLEKQMVEVKQTNALEIQQLSEELEHHRRVMEDVEKVKVKLDKEVEEWRAEALQGREDLQAKTSQVKAYKKQVDQLKESIAVKDQQIDALTENLGTLSVIKSDLQKKEIQRKKKKSKDGKTTAEQCPSSHEAMELQLAKTEALYNKLQIKYQKLLAERDDLKDKCDQFELSNKGLKIVLKDHINEDQIRTKESTAQDSQYQHGHTTETPQDLGNSKQQQIIREEHLPTEGNVSLPCKIEKSSITGLCVETDRATERSKVAEFQQFHSGPLTPTNSGGNHYQSLPNNSAPVGKTSFSVPEEVTSPTNSKSAQLIAGSTQFNQQMQKPLAFFEPSRHPAPDQGEFRNPQPSQGSQISSHIGSDQIRAQLDFSQRNPDQNSPVSTPVQWPDHHHPYYGNDQRVVHSLWQSQNYQQSQGQNYQQSQGQNYQQSQSQNYQQSQGQNYQQSQGQNYQQPQGQNYQQPNQVQYNQSSPFDYGPQQTQHEQAAGQQEQYRPVDNAEQYPPQTSNIPNEQTHHPYYNVHIGDHSQANRPIQLQVPTSQDNFPSTDSTAHNPPEAHTPGTEFGVDLQSPGLQQSPGKPIPKPRQLNPQVNRKFDEPSPIDLPTSQEDPNSTRMLVERNALHDNIYEDISEAAAEVSEVTKDENERKDAPLDPNLVCPMCMKQYRLGEIQLFRVHVNKCDGTKH